MAAQHRGNEGEGARGGVHREPVARDLGDAAGLKRAARIDTRLLGRPTRITSHWKGYTSPSCERQPE